MIYRGEGNAELRALWQAVEMWQKQGLKVAGLLNPLDEAGVKIRDKVRSLNDAREYVIMYDGGCAADVCQLNPRGLAASSEVIREALETPPDILVFNKFGHAESENSGLVTEYAQAAGQGIAVVSLLQEKYLPHWRAFTDGMGEELADGEDLTAWGAAVYARLK